MEKLKVAYVDFWPEWPEEDFITPILSKKYELVIDERSPDVVFHSAFGRTKRSDSYKGKKRIMFVGENLSPSRYRTEYSISFEPRSETNFRLPLWQAYILKTPSLKDRLYNRVNHENFERFCSFVVSNPSNIFRNAMYVRLNGYKRVHSYGRYMMNDSGLQEASRDRYWRDAKDEFFTKHTHKFAICYENNNWPYYCTEKLMDAFLAGSMPLYNGDPKVSNDFNRDAFINVPRHSDIMGLIKRIDSDRSEFDEIYSQPVFTDSQKASLENNLKEFETFLFDIIEK
jgi:hypothetical protein